MYYYIHRFCFVSRQNHTTFHRLITLLSLSLYYYLLHTYYILSMTTPIIKQFLCFYELMIQFTLFYYYYYIIIIKQNKTKNYSGISRPSFQLGHKRHIYIYILRQYYTTIFQCCQIIFRSFVSSFCLMFFTSNLATLNTTSTPQPHSRPPSKTRSMRLQQQQQPSSSASTAEQEAASHVQKAKSTRIEALKSDNRDLQPKPSSRKYPKKKNKTMISAENDFIIL